MLRRILSLVLSFGLASGVGAQSIVVEELSPAPVQPSVPERRVTEETQEAEQGVVAALRALDKVSGKSVDVELQTGASANVLGILVTMHECRYPSDNPTGDAFVYLSINDPNTGQLFFEGWMIASSPALNALDHRRYDLWVLRCNSA